MLEGWLGGERRFVQLFKTEAFRCIQWGCNTVKRGLIWGDELPVLDDPE